MTNTVNTYFKLGSDVNGASDLFKENLDRVKVIKKDDSTVMLIDDNKIISMITVLRDKANIINMDDMSITRVNKASQPHTYSVVGDIFSQILTKFEYNSPLLNDIIELIQILNNMKILSLIGFFFLN